MYATAVVAFIVLYFLIIPVAQYFDDTKGLRKYHNFYSLSGIYDLPFVYEAQKGFRSRNLFEAHKKHPVLRIGPNSISYSDTNAIKISMDMVQTALKIASTRRPEALMLTSPTSLAKRSTPAKEKFCPVPTRLKIWKNGSSKSPTSVVS